MYYPTNSLGRTANILGGFPSCTLVITHKPDAIVHSTQMDPNLNSSPKGFNISAQGNALGTKATKSEKP